MHDAVTAGNIPTTAEIVAGYVDGRYRWTDADWARFPDATKVRIAVLPSTNDGHVLDVEPGNGTPDQAPPWVTMRRAAGIDPTVYCSVSDWPVLKAAFAAQHVAEPHWWVAAYPGIGEALYDGSVAHQYADVDNAYDLSVVADHWPGIDPAPTPPPVVDPKDLDMTPAELVQLVAEVLRSEGVSGAAQAAKADQRLPVACIDDKSRPCVVEGATVRVVDRPTLQMLVFIGQVSLGHAKDVDHLPKIPSAQLAQLAGWVA